MKKYPDHVFDSIKGKEFTIKDTSAPYYLLGGYFECVKEPKTDNKILTWVSKTYANLMMDNFKNTFGFEPFNQNSAMPPDYKTELETTELCTDNNNPQCWQCIGDMQWAVALGQIYIMYATIVLLQ